MKKSSLPEPNQIAVARFLIPFYLLAIVGDIFFHFPPYQIAKNNSDLTYQWFGFILGWLPFLIILLFRAEKARQLLPLWARNKLNSLGFLALCASCGLKNTSVLIMSLMPGTAFATSGMAVIIQTVAVTMKWIGFGLFAFPGTLKSKGSIASSTEKKTRVALIVLKIILFAIAVWLITIDAKGLFVNP